MKLVLSEPMGNFSLYGYEDALKYTICVAAACGAELTVAMMKKAAKSPVPDFIPLDYLLTIDDKSYMILKCGKATDSTKPGICALMNYKGRGYGFEFADEITIDEFEGELYVRFKTDPKA